MLEREYQDINEGQWLSQTEIFKEGTPSNRIIFKVLPGLGATHGELKLYWARNSIIIEPNVPVIEGKESALDENGQRLYPNMLSVYGNKCKDQVVKYLKSQDYPKKIVCTPEAFVKKVKPAIEGLSDFNLYEDFFLLIDECDKLTTENDYRSRIIAPMEDFFLFKHKAMISATALEPSDDRFAQHGFKILELLPRYNFSKEINLIMTNNVLETINHVITRYDEESYFIFINSVTYPLVIAKALKIDHESKIFCAENSIDKVKGTGINCSSTLGDYRKYNFLTSRFYSAVDIKLPYKPNVLIVTNVIKAPHSIIDPYTEAIQIVGRFRNGFKTAAHIANFDTTIKVTDPTTLAKDLKDQYTQYKMIAKKLTVEETEGGRKALNQAIQRIDIKKFVDDKHQLLPYMVDNHIHEHQIRGYYKEQSCLAQVYQAVPFFDCTTIAHNYAITDHQLYAYGLAKTRQEKIRYAATFIRDWRSSRDRGEILFSFTDSFHEIEAKFPEIVRYVDVVGYDRLESLDFNERAIKSAMNKAEQNNILFSPKVIEEIQSWYSVGQNPSPLQTTVKSRLRTFLTGIGYKGSIKGSFIHKYYDVKSNTIKGNQKVWDIQGIIS